MDPIHEGLPPKPPPVASKVATTSTSEEDEARQAIEMLRGDDVSGRIAAANRLDTVASALGEERTREVCLQFSFVVHQLCGRPTRNFSTIVRIRNYFRI